MIHSVWRKIPADNCSPATLRNHRATLGVDHRVQIDVTEKAAAVIRKRGGTAVVDLLEPYG